MITTRGLFFLVASILLLSGCVSAPATPESVETQLHQQKLASLTHWQLRGRLAFKSEQEKFSAYLHWEQQDQSYDLNLNTFIGTNLVAMQGHPGFAQLEADDQIYTDASAARLIQRTTGWNIPVELLSLWIKGQYTSNDTVIFDQAGLVQQITTGCEHCDPWTLTYSNYTLVDGVWLPQQMLLTNSGVQSNTIKIRINSWQIK